MFLRWCALFTLAAASSCTPAVAQWSFNPQVNHVPQTENWICGPTTISMWAGHIRQQSLDPYRIADSCCGRDGTNIPEFVQGIFDWTPYGYVFAEWEYSNDKAAVKGIMWTIARFGQPVAVAGGSGIHYVLVRGGRADRNPYDYYGDTNHIRGVWVNDATEGSSVYAGPVSGMYRNNEYSPAVLMLYWRKIGGWFDKKYRSVERECYACWSRQGRTYENNDSFSSY